MKSKFLSLLCSVVLLGLFGCDMVDSVKDQISKKDKQVAATEKTAVSTSTKTENKTENVNKPLAPNVLARVGDWQITIDEFNEQLKAVKEMDASFDVDSLESKKLILEEVVRQRLVIIGAKKSGLADDENIVKAVENFKNNLIVQEAAYRLTENIKVTDAEIEEFYEEQREVLVDPIQFRVSQIVVETEAKAQELKLELIKGVDFGELAKAHSIAENAAQGGDLGIITEEPFQQMANAIVSLEQGETSNVFSGPEGFYIIKLTEKKGGTQIPLDKIREEISQGLLFDKQQKAILDHIKKLEETTRVDTNQGLLEQVKK